MKKLIKFVLPIVLILAVVLSFGACSSGKPKKSENAIEGKWFLGEDFDDAGFRFPDELEFFSDGSMQGPAGGKYTISGDRIQIYYTAMDSYTYTFKIEDNMLKLVDSETGDYYGEYIYYREAGVKNSDSDSETTTVQEAEKLSASCDYILAQATDSKGNYIELVANDSETYDGSQSIGLIKNNKWVIEMTDDSPIIEDGVVVFFNNYKLYKRSGDTNISFITDNCIKFHEASKEFFWNYKTGKTCEMKMNGEDKIVGFTGYKEKTLLNEKYIIIMENAHSYINSTCKTFDTDTMQFAKVFDTRYFDGGSVQVFSEGLFFARRDRNADSNAEVGGFYDINGNLVIDFSKFEDKYKINRYPERFIDGKTSFRAKNASGKEFEITIDKQGNVLSETAV